MVKNAPPLADVLVQLRALEAKVADATEQKTTSSEKGGISAVWGWVIGLIAAAAIAIGAFFLLRKLRKRNEELAALRTQVEQDKVTKVNLEHEIAVEDHQVRRELLEVQAAELDTDIRRREHRQAVVQAMNDDLMERVLQAQTWKELDDLNDENR